MTELHATREDHLIAMLAALAITIAIAESSLPSPLPGIKPGLANVVSLIVFLLYGWRAAVWVSLLRVLVGSLILGTFLSPAFFLSLSGALCSLFVLGIGSLVGRGQSPWRVGPIGYAVLAAMAHMAGQFFTAYFVFIPHKALLHLLPVLMTAAFIFGMVSGRITLGVVRRLDQSKLTVDL